MKVGLFGDSFAEDFIPCQNWIYDDKNITDEPKLLKRLKSKIPAYWQLLSLQGITINTSFGRGGTDIHYSYRQFMENHHRFDTNLFIITHPTRISVPYKRQKQKYFDWIHGTNPEVTLQRIKSQKSVNDMIGADVAEGIYQYQIKAGYHNSSRDFVFAGCIVDSILMHRPDTKFINAFSTWSPMSPSIKKTATLYDIHCIENNRMGLGTNNVWPDWNGKVDQRRAHISSEGHRILADDLNRFIKSDHTWFDFDTQPYESIKVDHKNWFISRSELIPWLTNLGIDKF